MRNIFTKAEENITQSFTENPTIRRKGKDIDAQNYIDSFKADTEIYSLIDKYGCTEKIPMDTQIIESDLQGIKDRRDILDAQIKSEKLWKELPLEIRKEFGNNINEFRQNGLKYFKELNQKLQAQQQEEQTSPKEEGSN